MQTTRRIGIEMEGYIDSYPEDVSISGVSIKQDGSLDNSDWEYSDEPYGVELVTDPMTDLDSLYRTWHDMEENEWRTDGHAGTHIHVEINDFSPYEMVKLLRFGKGIERIIFMFVQSYRYDNQYCEPIHKEWRKMFRPKGKYADIKWEEFSNKSNISSYMANTVTGTSSSRQRRLYGSNYPWNGRYQWMNVLGSRFNTVEFRIFHAVESVEELIQQVRLAEGIVNFVKNTSLEQMEFVLKELYKQTSVKDLTEKFFSALGLDFTLPTIGQEAYLYLHDKLSKNAVEEDETASNLAQLMQAL